MPLVSISSFLEAHNAKFHFGDISNQERDALLGDINQTLACSEPSEDILEALTAVKVLSRDKQVLTKLATPELLDRLQVHSGISHYKQEGTAVLMMENMNQSVVTEALKCLCNMVFNNTTVSLYCHTNEVALSLIQRAKTYCDSGVADEVKQFDMRLLFLITALNADSRKNSCLNWDGISTLTEIIKYTLDKENEISDTSADILIDVMKSLFNMTLSCSPWQQASDDLLLDLHKLTRETRRLLLSSATTKEKKSDLVKHSINLLTNIPKSACGELVPHEDEAASESAAAANSDYARRKFEDCDIRTFREILNYLERALESATIASQKDVLLPVLSTLTSLSRGHRVIRKYCRMRVLPHMRDEVKRLPEEGDHLRNKLCKLLTSPITEVKKMVAEFLFVLCKEDVQRLIKYSGFGNAAGLLAQYGLLAGKRESIGDYSSGSDSETEEYRELESNVNPVTGRYEIPKPDPMEGMSDEQKEYEAERLLNAMDKLQRLGVVQPSTIGPDGKPQPVEHVLQLAESRNPPTEDQ